MFDCNGFLIAAVFIEEVKVISMPAELLATC